MDPKQESSDDIEEDLNFYSQAQLEQSLDDDEISSMEEGFMVGYLGWFFYFRKIYKDFMTSAGEDEEQIF